MEVPAAKAPAVEGLVGGDEDFLDLAEVFGVEGLGVDVLVKKMEGDFATEGGEVREDIGVEFFPVSRNGLSFLKEFG